MSTKNTPLRCWCARAPVPHHHLDEPDRVGRHLDGTPHEHAACHGLGYNAGERREFERQRGIREERNRYYLLLAAVLWECGSRLPESLRNAIKAEGIEPKPREEEP